MDFHPFFSSQLSHVGLEEWRHKLGHCFEDERFSQKDLGFCGDPRCQLARDSRIELLRDRRTSRAWLFFPGKPAAPVIAALKAAGWRWSGYRQAWNNPRRGVLPPEGLPWMDGGECDFSDERAERLEQRAEKASGQAEAAYSTARAIVAPIPFGQPVLVGHHSERRHRRALERSDSHMGKAVALSRKAGRLESAADGSRAHQEHQDSALGTSLRLGRLRTELAKLKRAEAQWQNHRETYLRRVEDLENRIKADELALAALPPLPCQEEDVQAGDKVRIRGHIVVVTRVNPKTYTGVIVEGGARGMCGKWSREYLQAVIQRRALNAEQLRALAER